ncbi:MAG: hypothetical protein IPJ79_00970 [Bacteroidetes bacterium]|nr:hypothetical protein [Bacteroidota bacterium]
MNKTFLLFLFLLTATLYSARIDAQRAMNIGVATGFTNYFGDLGNDEFYQGSSTRPGASLTFRNFLNNPAKTGMQYQSFDVETRLSWQRIGYDETKPIGSREGYDLRNYGRGLSFRTDVLGFSSHLSYTWYPNKRKPLDKQGAVMFGYIGLGIFYANPKADLFLGDIDINNRYYFWNDGTVRDAPQEGEHANPNANVIKKDGKYETDLHDWKTEGQGFTSELGQKPPYNLLHIGIPMGFGWRWGIAKNITLSAEFSYYKFVTDYLDDVSERYATYEEIAANYPGDAEKQELAKYISDPTGKGTNGFNGEQTSKRGNKIKTDGYTYISMEIAYKLDFFNFKKIK